MCVMAQTDGVPTGITRFVRGTACSLSATRLWRRQWRCDARYTDAFPYQPHPAESDAGWCAMDCGAETQLPDEGYDERADRDHKSLRNLEPVFDAANVLRADRDLFFLESNSGNALGAAVAAACARFPLPVHRPERHLQLHAPGQHGQPSASGAGSLNPDRLNSTNIPAALRKMADYVVPAARRYRVCRTV